MIAFLRRARAQFLQRTHYGLLHLDARVRLVEMRGCMAHTRHNEREGVVTGFVQRTPYGWHRPINYVQILMDDDHTVTEVPDTPGLWHLHDGLPEYSDI